MFMLNLLVELLGICAIIHWSRPRSARPQPLLPTWFAIRALHHGPHGIQTCGPTNVLAPSAPSTTRIRFNMIQRYRIMVVGPTNRTRTCGCAHSNSSGYRAKRPSYYCTVVFSHTTSVPVDGAITRNEGCHSRWLLVFVGILYPFLSICTAVQVCHDLSVQGTIPPYRYLSIRRGGY